MPWRLIGFILLAAVFLGFIGFNLENSSDISLGFYTFSQVPVYLTAFASLVLGMILALPLAIAFRRRVREAIPKKGEEPAVPARRLRGKAKKTAASDHIAPGGGPAGGPDGGD
jgi:uncharacterized integral membrane protein